MRSTIIGNQNLSFYLLLGLVVSLPLLEAPKNIFLVLFVVNSAVVIATRISNIPRTNFVTGIPFLLLALSGMVSVWTSLNPLALDPFQWALYPLSGFLVVSLGLTEDRIRILITAMLIGCIVAMLESKFWQYEGIELRSVGYKTHSILFVIVSGVAAIFSLQDKTSSLFEYGLATITLIFLMFAVTSSNTGVGPLGLSILALFLIWSGVGRGIIRFRNFVVISVCFIFIVAVLVEDASLNQGLVTNFYQSIDSEIAKSKNLLESALVSVSGNRFWFGYGVGQFAFAVSADNLESLWISSQNAGPLPQEFVSSNHGHGIFSTLIVERGVVGTIFFATGILTYSLLLLNRVLTKEGQNLHYLFLGFATVLIQLMLGMVQTTFHLEHGLLGFLMMALAFGRNQTDLISREKHTKPSLKIFAFGNENVPSTRFRVMQYLEIINSHFDCKLVHGKPTLSDLIGRPGEIVWIQKQLVSSNLLVISRFFTKGKLVYDFDDAIWEPSASLWTGWTKMRTQVRFKAITMLADQIQTSSVYLSKFVPRKKTIVIPVSVPETQVDSREMVAINTELVFGWSGKVSSAYQLRDVLDRLPKKLFDEFRLIILSGEDPRLDLAYEYWPYSQSNEIEFYQTVDVGIVPSTARPFDLGKTPVKALQHFAYGKTVIANPRGAGAEFITKECAIVVENGDWERAFHLVISGVTNLKELSQRALVVQRSQYSRDMTCGRLIQALQDVTNN